MKKFFLFLLVCLSLSAVSQTREELVGKLLEHYNAGEYDKALPYAKLAVAAAKKEVGEHHIEYAVALSDMALMMYLLGDFEESLPHWNQAAAIRKALLGEAHPDYLRNMREIASVHHSLGNYPEAIRIRTMLADTWLYLEGPYSENYAVTLSVLGQSLLSAGDYDSCEQVLLKSEQVLKAVYGTNHTEYAAAVSALGILNIQLARYGKAEPYLLHALRVNQQDGDKTEEATAYSNLGYLYFALGQYDQAEEKYFRSLDIRRELGDTLSNEYATILGNFGVLLNEQEKYDRALSYFQTASSIRKKLFGPEHPEYAVTLQNLSAVYYWLGQHEKVEPLIKEVIRIYKKTLGEDHPDYATSISNLAAHYYDRKEYAKIEPLLEETLKIRKKLYGESHPDFSMSLRNLALLNLEFDRPEKAQEFLIQQNLSIKSFLETTFDFLPEQEREDYLQNVYVLDDNSSFLVNYKKASPEMLRTSLEQLLYLKSLSLSGVQHMLQALRRSADTATRRSYESWLEKKKELASLITQGEEDNKDAIKKLNKEATEMEKLLMQRSSDFRKQQAGRSVKITDLQKQLAPDEAVIEFVRYDYYLKDWTDSVYYGAYILNQQDALPQFIHLFEEKQLQALFDSAGTTAVEQAFSFYRGLEKKSRNNSGVIGEQLYKLVWEPLEPYLKGIKKISYSPSGLLYNISLNALPVDSNTLLLDRYAFRQYTSTRHIASRGEQVSMNGQSSIVLFGDAQFDEVVAVADSTDIPVSALARRGGRSKWESLPGTAKEVKNISALFRDRGQPAREYVKKEASEEHFKLLSEQSPRILHIATHGFFLPAPEKKKEKKAMSVENSYSNSENPLVRSGLVFSGANQAWSGKQVTEGEDGIATAYEISQLDLSNTELVVLSACETALGDIKGSEGVMGLQRAFKIAGVRKLIVSLWQVPDKETAELMTAFYGYLLGGRSIEEAFTQAQADMRKKYDPFYWAAFVLVE